MKLSTYYTTIVHQAEWNQPKGEKEGKKNLYKISKTMDVINHGKSMSHQQDVARRDVQHVRKDNASTEGGLTSFYQSFMHYILLACSRNI